MKNYIKLIRLDKPTGIFLLFWPCSWGLVLGNSSSSSNEIFYYHLLLFLIGSFLMRSAGCVYNDIIDKKIDIKIARTKTRPITSGLISASKGWFLIVLFVALSLIILVQFNFKSIIFGLSSSFFVILYPFMKRITYWPQLFLGVTFNWGIILGWLSMGNEIALIPVLLYISAIFWTLGYDTIYGMQDIQDDIKIGVKSTSIKFHKNIKLFLSTCYLISFGLFIVLLILLNVSLTTYFLTFLSSLILIVQIFLFDSKEYKKNAKLFALNNYYGLSIFLILLITMQNG